MKPHIGSQLRTGIRRRRSRVTGSNPVEALNFFQASLPHKLVGSWRGSCNCLINTLSRNNRFLLALFTVEVRQVTFDLPALLFSKIEANITIAENKASMRSTRRPNHTWVALNINHSLVL